MRAPELVTPPKDTPVTLAQLKAQARIPFDDDDVYLTSLIEAATGLLDGWTGLLGRALMPQVWRQDFTSFAAQMRLPFGPIQSIEGFTYLDGDGVETPFEDYTLGVDGLGPSLHLVTGWPSIQPHSLVSVTFTAGYADAAAVPAPIRQAILIQAATMYEHREDFGEQATPLRIVDLMTRPFRRIGL